MQSLFLSLWIPSEEYQRLYAGQAINVYARAEDGRSVSFPARVLQPFLEHSGIRGRFRLDFDNDNKFSGIHRVRDNRI